MDASDVQATQDGETYFSASSLENNAALFVLNAGVNRLMDENWSTGVFYTLEARSREVSQEFNASLRCSF